MKYHEWVYITRISFSESPLHLLTTELADILKNVVLHSVATACASRVFPNKILTALIINYFEMSSVSIYTVLQIICLLLIK